MNLIPTPEKISEYIDSMREEMLSVWEQMVNLEGRINESEHTTKLANFIMEEFKKSGMETQLLPTYEGIAPYVYGIINKESTKKPIVFSGHFDTVFSKGHFGDNPFRIENGKAYGPGVLDMKGGIVITIFVIRALVKFGYTDRPIKVFFVSDEENKALPGNTRPIHLFHKEVEGALCGFNMETGLPGNNLCIGRKCAGIFEVDVKGVASHAGANFTDGVNAIEEMAHKILALQKLTDLEKNITVSCDVISGGTVFNAIPDKCSLKVDMRFVRNADVAETVKKAEEICKITTVEGTTTEYTYTQPMPAFESTDGVKALFDFVKSSAASFGITINEGVVLGGASDASQYGKYGVPVICSCGVVGEANHTPKEYAVVESLFERAKLYTNLMYVMDDFKV